jgi:lipopolysaccharide transport system ATP-binding protein
LRQTVIKAQNLSKQYRIGEREGYKTFREAVVNITKAPFKRFSSALTNQTNLTNPTKETNLIWALKDVSFEVNQGEVVGIIGRNGAGKSTLLKILSKITVPTEGSVELRGRVGSLLEIGTGFHPELTGHENIYLYGAILGMDRWEVTRKFSEILAFAELEKFIDTPVKRYSSGMYMRLAFAVAAHLEPEILLVDEVLAVGDATFQKKCLGKMGDVSKEGRTVLFVSHNMGAVEELCNRIILLQNGHIEQIGLPRDVIRSYLDKGLVSSPYVDTTHHSGRRQNMTPVISSMELTNAAGVRTSMFSLGEDIFFRFSLSSPDKPYPSPGLSIAVQNVAGFEICKLTTLATVRKPWQVSNRTTAKCIWQNCRLSPGKYYLRVGLSNANQVVDLIDSITAIEIMPSSEVVAGKVPPGFIIPEVTWDFE